MLWFEMRYDEVGELMCIYIEEMNCLECVISCRECDISLEVFVGCEFPE